jgi:hypothetical protein
MTSCGRRGRSATFGATNGSPARSNWTRRPWRSSPMTRLKPHESASAAKAKSSAENGKKGGRPKGSLDRLPNKRATTIAACVMRAVTRSTKRACSALVGTQVFGFAIVSAAQILEVSSNSSGNCEKRPHVIQPSYQTCQTRWVASSIKTFSPARNLSFSHHKEVAALPINNQD